MSNRGGRERFRRDDVPPTPSSSSRFHDRPRGGSGQSNPPSRHLWVGSVSHHLSEPALADQFLRFGALESLAFQPGRSYAFVNYKREEDAIDAMNSLQGFVLAGLPLRIEFAKADKSSAPSRDENHMQRRDEIRSSSRASPLPQRESRNRQSSPDSFLADGVRSGGSSSDPPSEVLWIGFPALMRVDEMILRKAFSPFGDIEKITVFPGRSYAFVRFKSLSSACRAKETLQGKLFGNPRVHICFAKSETGFSNAGRRSGAGESSEPPSPRFTNGRAGSFDNSVSQRDLGGYHPDHTRRPHHFASNMEYGDQDMVGFGVKESWRRGRQGGGFEQKRLHEQGVLPDGLQGYRNNPVMGGNAPFREFSPRKFARRSPLPEEPWDSPEGPHAYRDAKRPKTQRFPPEKELPEYPFSVSEQGRHVMPRMLSEFPLQDEPAPLGYRQIPDHPPNIQQRFMDRSDNWGAPPDAFHTSSASFSSHPAEWNRSTPDIQQGHVANNEWKWEGTIAKGGTPVCHARCFPVGKVLDFLLPEILDCTARTGLDMLAKHYYQAAGTWVVFFVPASDADIGYYNEFMNYLGEKQRAAVAKIDDRNTLFLVPPSDFSEKVLKVPGKLSISGVVLRLDPPTSNLGPVAATHERKDASIMPPLNDTLYGKSGSPSGLFPPVTPFSNPVKGGFSNPLLPINPSNQGQYSLPGYDHAGQSFPDSLEKRHEYLPSQQDAAGLVQNWSPHQQQNPVPVIRMTPQTTLDAVGSGLAPNMGNYNGGFPRAQPVSNKSYSEETMTSASLSMPYGGLQPEQLAQLATSLLGQQRQPGTSSTVPYPVDFRSSSENHPENLPKPPQRHTNEVPAELSASQFGQLLQQAQQLPQAVNIPAAPQGQVSQQFPGTGSTQVEADADPQKRLQATLQLAAALLQQIQQGKGT